MQEDFEFKLSDHVEHDGYMPNVYPPRKMFSSSPAPKGIDVSPDNRTGGNTILLALAKAIKKDGKLKTPKKTEE